MQNTNVIPARKLTKKQDNKNLQIDYVPQGLYKYSFHDSLKEREQKRIQIEKDVYKNRKKKKKINKTFPFILALVTTTFFLLNKKINK